MPPPAAPGKSGMTSRWRCWRSAAGDKKDPAPRKTQRRGAGSKQLLLAGGLRVEGGVLMMAADKDLPGLFRHGAAVVPGDRAEGTGNVVVAEQMLDKILRHGGQTVGVLNVFVVIIAVEKANLAGAA